MNCILITDADDDLVTRLPFFFEDKGYETTSAWNGKEALTKLHSRQFDVILLSDCFDDGSCKEIWRAIHRLPCKPTPVVFESPRRGPELAKRLSDVNGVYVAKKKSAYLIFESV